MAPEEWFYIKSELKIDPEKGFEKLYNRLWEKMYSVSYNYVRDKAAAQEIVQDVFVSLWTKRDRLAEVNDILAFTMRAVQNRVYDHFDKQDVQQRYAMHVSKSDNPARETTQQQIEFNETFSIIDKEINSLPETTKTIFRLSRFHSFSNEEIAIKLQVSVKAVEYHITQALKKLRLRMRYTGLLSTLFCSIKAIESVALRLLD